MGADIDITKAIANLNFGSTFNVPYINYDEVGHVTGSGNYTVTIPTGSLSDTSSTADTANVLTSINFTSETGAITTTHQNVGTLKLTGYTPTTTVSDDAILATDSLNAAIGKLEFRINDLDVEAITSDAYSFISEISETDGKVAAKTALLDGVKLKATPTLTNTAIAADDTLISALGKLQAQINSNANAIKTLDEGLDSEKIDSVKDLIAYTEEHGETTKEIVDAIGKKASTDANGNPTASTGIYSLIDAEAAARESLISNVQADWNATEGLAVILNKPTNLVTSDQITNMVEDEDIQGMITENDPFTYRQLSDKAGNSISPETTLTIQGLLNKVAELEERIYALEHPDIQPPVEEPTPEEGEEETPTE